MAFERITDGDLLGKGNLGRPDTPGVDTAEMQRILDELPREVIVPAFNRLAEQLEAQSAAAGLGAAVPAGLPEDTPATVQGTLEAALNKSGAHAARTDNPHAVTAAQAGAYTREETDAAIAQRVVEIGTGDMAQAVYDPTGQKKDVFAAIGQAVASIRRMKISGMTAPPFLIISQSLTCPSVAQIPAGVNLASDKRPGFMLHWIRRLGYGGKIVSEPGGLDDVPFEHPCDLGPFL